MIPEESTPCYSEEPELRQELTRLFDSTRFEDHRYAARMCRECPFLLGCRRLARELARDYAWAGVPVGTWGGELYMEGRRRRVAGVRT